MLREMNGDWWLRNELADGGHPAGSAAGNP